MTISDVGGQSFAREETRRIVRFLSEIGLEVRPATIAEETFLPGILIRDGVLLVDESRLTYPGDLLHDAGHLAVVTPEERRTLVGNLKRGPHEEMAAIAWSWAALVHLRLPPELVFHEEGYRGGSQSLINAFTHYQGPGIPWLAWLGMCSDPRAGPDVVNELPPFPEMTRWLCESEPHWARGAGSIPLKGTHHDRFPAVQGLHVRQRGP